MREEIMAKINVLKELLKDYKDTNGYAAPKLINMVIKSAEIVIIDNNVSQFENTINELQDIKTFVLKYPDLTI